MSSLSLDLNPEKLEQDSAKPLSGMAQSLDESTVPLPAPTMLQGGKLVEPIDLSRVTSEGGTAIRMACPPARCRSPRWMAAAICRSSSIWRAPISRSATRKVPANCCRRWSINRKIPAEEARSLLREVA
jgi:hypothetical protein